MKCYVCEGECEEDVLNAGYTYWKCRHCHTAQVQPQPSAQALQTYYDAFHLSNQVGGMYDECEERMTADFPAKAQLARRYVSTPRARLLDVGCGKGFFVKTASDAGFDAQGIDLSASGVRYAVDTLGVKATAGRIQDLAADEAFRGQFDIVTFWATIEHLADPQQVIAAIKMCLKPGGVLVCDTGLGHIGWERLMPGHSQWYDAPQHLFVFSQDGLVHLLEKSGFSVLKLDKNFERSVLRRAVRWVRHAAICSLGGLIFRPLLGAQGFEKMQRERAWPIGRLVSVVAVNG
jgi:SAM-dependent methyltransferase